jgi:hypothetical protein
MPGRTLAPHLMLPPLVDARGRGNPGGRPSAGQRPLAEPHPFGQGDM